MTEQTNTTQETTAEETAAQSAAQENTETKTFTQEDLNRVGAKEKKQGEAAILKELGLSSKDEIAAFKEQMAAFKAEKEKGQTAEEKMKAYEEQQAALKAERDAAITEREQARQEAWCIKQGIPEEKADFYLFKIGKLMAAEEIDFDTAAAQYLKENPAEEKQETKPMWGGSAKKPVGSVDDEINQWRAEAGLKVKEK